MHNSNFAPDDAWHHSKLVAYSQVSQLKHRKSDSVETVIQRPWLPKPKCLRALRNSGWNLQNYRFGFVQLQKGKPV